MKVPGGAQVVEQLTAGMAAFFGAGSEGSAASEAITPEMMMAMMQDMPLHAMSAYAGEAFSREAMEGLIAMLNQQQIQENLTHIARYIQYVWIYRAVYSDMISEGKE